jgi:hypothetical protein
MTRREAIDVIDANLTHLDEDALATLVQVTTSWTLPSNGFPLTEADHNAIERSHADFKAGRTLTLDEAEARTDAFLARRRAERAGS